MSRYFILCAGLSLFMVQANAAGFRVPYYFTAGSPISSQEMNTNFEAIDRQFTDVIDKKLSELEKSLQKKEKRIQALEKQIRQLKANK